MIMKNGKRVRFIYKNGKRIDKIIRHGKVYFEQGFTREKTSTTLPISFDGIGKDLKDYKIYGNTVQNGVPAPDTPIEMVSCGDRTKNLWNSFNKNQTDNYKVLKDGTIQLIKSSNGPNGYTNIGYTLKQMCPDLEVGDTVYLYIESTWYRKEIYSSSLGASNAWTNGTSRILTEQMLNENLVLYGGYQTTSTIKIMITKNQYYDTYEPYYEGYKIPVNVRSENLFDKDNVNVLNAYISLGNSKITSSNSDKCLYMPIKSNTTYAISKILSSRFVIGCVDEEPVLNSSVCNPISGNQASNTTYTITSGNNSKYLVIFYYVTSDILIEQQILDSIQIVEGSTVPDKYIPYYNETTNIYLDEPLRKIDGYSDYIDFINGRVVRKIKEDILNGNENWTAYGSNLYTVQKIYNNNPFIVGYGLSNLYIYNSIQSGINAGTVNGEFALQKSGQHYSLFIKNTDIGSLENLKSSLSIKNMTLQYPLATPTEESITLPNIPTVDGNNTLNIETEITPSQVYIKYRSDN